MKKPGISFAILVVTAALLAGGCGTARRGAPLAPAFVPADPVVARGQQVFYAQCHHCHPHGEAGLGPALNNKPLPGFLVKFQARHGLGTMPAFSQDRLPADELDALVAYLAALRASPAPEIAD